MWAQPDSISWALPYARLAVDKQGNNLMEPVSCQLTGRHFFLVILNLVCGKLLFSQSGPTAQPTPQPQMPSPASWVARCACACGHLGPGGEKRGWSLCPVPSLAPSLTGGTRWTGNFCSDISSSPLAEGLSDAPMWYTCLYIFFWRGA